MPFPVNTQLYSRAIKHWEHPSLKQPRVFPTIYPNWDNSPRVGKSALIIHNSTPKLFETHVLNTLKLIENKASEDKVIFLRSWNEWAEGNYMEPDVKFGKGYIEALKRVLS
jgi:hypothetical protein